MEHVIWTEKYRPTTVEDCILPTALKAQFTDMVTKGTVPNLLLTGRAGIGKTTIAKALCEQLGADYMIINGSEESGIDVLRTKIQTYASAVSLMGGRKYIILDEADYLNPNSTQPALRGVMEEFAHNCGFILTCNYHNRLIEPLQSRLGVIHFDIPKSERKALMVQVAKRVQTILAKEQVACDTALLGEVVKSFFPDIRRMLNEMQRSVSNGVVTPVVLGSFRDAVYVDLFTHLKARDFFKMRTWLAEHEDIEHTQMFKVLYEWVLKEAPKGAIPIMVNILNDHQYKAAFVADQNLNLTACCTELMANMES
jgi:DNA polymerase III delta prime subunit